LLQAEDSREKVEGDRRWSDLQNRVNSYLAAMGVQAVGNAPDSHALAPGVREVKRGLRERIASPLPHFANRSVQRADEAQRRRLKEERREKVA
jgi:hypothetical protein